VSDVARSCRQIPTTGHVIQSAKISLCYLIRVENACMGETGSNVSRDDLDAELDPLEWDLRGSSERGEIKDDFEATLPLRGAR
jgi:hypothetical protein